MKRFDGRSWKQLLIIRLIELDLVRMRVGLVKLYFS